MRRRIRPFWSLLSVMAVALQAPPTLADSVPFLGAKASVPIDTPINQLKKGEFLWMAEAVSAGPVVMVVSVTEQIPRVPAGPTSHNTSHLHTAVRARGLCALLPSP
jgi:hypothetical protein